MKYILTIYVLLISLSIPGGEKDHKSEISKKNGKIILAYKGFEKFLASQRTWGDYKKYVLEEYETLNSIHQRYVDYGIIDTSAFMQEVTDYSVPDFAEYFNNISRTEIEKLYDLVIPEIDSILVPLNKVDICFFLPYGKDCYVENVNDRQTIFISIKYDIHEMDLILTHEYAHCLHHQRRPKEEPVLKRWIVSEGIASIFPTLLSHQSSIYEGLWMMPKESIDWCMKNERQIIDSISLDIDKNGLEISKKFIAGGEGFATPPIGFPEKTGYYLGYRIIEECMANGLCLTDICQMDSETVLSKSGLLEKLADSNTN